LRILLRMVVARGQFLKSVPSQGVQMDFHSSLLLCLMPVILEFLVQIYVLIAHVFLNFSE
jgi:hypothetical protein